MKIEDKIDEYLKEAKFKVGDTVTYSDVKNGIGKHTRLHKEGQKGVIEVIRTNSLVKVRFPNRKNLVTVNTDQLTKV